VAVAVIRVSFKALSIAGFGSGETIGLIAESAEAMVRRAKVIITIGISRVGIGCFLELLQSILILAALEERHTIGIVTIGNEVRTAAHHHQASADKDNGYA
jgi:hypothetical protein